MASLIVSSLACSFLLKHRVVYDVCVHITLLFTSIFKCEQISSLFYSKYKASYVFAGIVWGTMAKEAVQFLLVGALSHHLTISFDFEQRMVGNTVQYVIHYDYLFRILVMSCVSYVFSRLHVSKWKCDFVVFTLELSNHIMFLLTDVYLWQLSAGALIDRFVKQYEELYY